MFENISLYLFNSLNIRQFSVVKVYQNYISNLVMPQN